jgi:hypothetical protein
MNQHSHPKIAAKMRGIAASSRWLNSPTMMATSASSAQRTDKTTVSGFLTE